MMNDGSLYSGPVAGPDELDGVLRDLVDVLQHLGAEGHHDLGVVALGAVEDFVAVGEQVARRQVRAEEVAAEEDLVFGQPGAHGLGPVHPRREHEGQRLVAQREGLAVGHDQKAGVVDVQVVDQQRLGLGVADDGELGEALEQQGRAARVILLDVVDDQVVGRGKLVELAGQRSPLGRIDRVDQGVLLAALHEVGVVACAVGQRDEGVEQAPVPVDVANQIDVVADRSCLHGFQTPIAGARYRASIITAPHTAAGC